MYFCFKDENNVRFDWHQYGHQLVSRDIMALCSSTSLSATVTNSWRNAPFEFGIWMHYLKLACVCIRSAVQTILTSVSDRLGWVSLVNVTMNSARTLRHHLQGSTTLNNQKSHLVVVGNERMNRNFRHHRRSHRHRHRHGLTSFFPTYFFQA